MGTRLYVGNLSFQTSKDTLLDAFRAHGEVIDVHLVTDRESGQPRGFGFVTMGTDAQAAQAIRVLDGSFLDGRSIKVNEAQERTRVASSTAARGPTRGR